MLTGLLIGLLIGAVLGFVAGMLLGLPGKKEAVELARAEIDELAKAARTSGETLAGVSGELSRPSHGDRAVPRTSQQLADRAPGPEGPADLPPASDDPRDRR